MGKHSTGGCVYWRELLRADWSWYQDPKGVWRRWPGGISAACPLGILVEGGRVPRDMQIQDGNDVLEGQYRTEQ